MKIFLGAVVDGEFLTDTAEKLLQRKELMNVPVMMGITNHEFGWILPQVTLLNLLIPIVHLTLPDIPLLLFMLTPINIQLINFRIVS